MSLILDSLRRRKDPLEAWLRPPHQSVDAATEPGSSAAGGSTWTGAHVVICILFLVILAVCGWVLLEWLLASHYNLGLP